MITIQITNGPPAFSIPWQSGMNVQQAMEVAYTVAPKGTFTYALQYYGPTFGNFVIMINETYESFSGQQAPFFFWELLVNGTISSKGIDSTILNDGDAVTFEFTAYHSSAPSYSTTHVKYALKTMSMN